MYKIHFTINGLDFVLAILTKDFLAFPGQKKLRVTESVVTSSKGRTSVPLEQQIYLWPKRCERGPGNGQPL